VTMAGSPQPGPAGREGDGGRRGMAPDEISFAFSKSLKVAFSANQADS